MKHTKIAIATWPSDTDRMHPIIVTKRLDYIEKARLKGVTDGIPTNVTDQITTRTWVDQESAQDWANFITALAADFDIPVTVVIEDLAN